MVKEGDAQPVEIESSFSTVRERTEQKRIGKTITGVKKTR